MNTNIQSHTFLNLLLTKINIIFFLTQVREQTDNLLEYRCKSFRVVDSYYYIMNLH